MIPWRSVIVTGLGGVLLLALGGEVRGAFGDDPGEPVTLATAGGPEAVATPGQAVPLVADTGGILSRPLFNWNRRAVAGAGALDGPLPRLSGIIISPAGRYAIFAAPVGSKPQTVPQGGAVGRFTIDAITPDHIILRNGANSQNLQTHFGATPPPPMATPDAS